MQIPNYKVIYLDLTLDCDENCSFCYRKILYKNHDVFGGELGDVYMTETTGLKAIKFALEELNITDDCNFYFWGGEPFLNFKVIKSIVEKYPQLNYFISTHGASITDEIRDWLLDKKRMTIAWSMSNAFEKYGSIEEKVKRESNMLEVAKKHGCTVNYLLHNPKTLIEDFDYLIKNVSPIINVDFITQRAYSDEEIQLFEENYLKLINMYMLPGQICEHLNPAISNALWNETFGYKHFVERAKYCEPGIRELWIATNGDIFPCDGMYLMRRSKLGTLDTGIDFNKIQWSFKIKENKDNYLLRDCVNCEAYGYCPRNKCLGLNLETTGNMFKCDENFCRMCRAIFRVIKKFIEQEKVRRKNG